MRLDGSLLGLSSLPFFWLGREFFWKKKKVYVGKGLAWEWGCVVLVCERAG